MNKILFLHGMFGQNSSKPNFLKLLGFEVFCPFLSDWNFKKSITTAQEAFEKLNPDLIVGSSRGGAVAMNIDSKDKPLVLLAPAWSFFGNKNTTKENSIIIHSENDTLISVESSIELSKRSNCELILSGEDHRLNCKNARKSLEIAVNKLIN